MIANSRMTAVLLAAALVVLISSASCAPVVDKHSMRHPPSSRIHGFMPVQRHSRHLLINSASASSESNTVSFGANGQSADFHAASSGTVGNRHGDTESKSVANADVNLHAMRGASRIGTNANTLTQEHESELSTNSVAEARTANKARTDAVSNVKLSADPRHQSSQAHALPGKAAFGDAQGLANANGYGLGWVLALVDGLGGVTVEAESEDAPGFAASNAKGSTHAGGDAANVNHEDDYLDISAESDIALDVMADPDGETDATSHAASDATAHRAEISQTFSNANGMADAFDSDSADIEGRLTEAGADAGALGSATGTATSNSLLVHEDAANVAHSKVNVAAAADADANGLVIVDDSDPENVEYIPIGAASDATAVGTGEAESFSTGAYQGGTEEMNQLVTDFLGEGADLDALSNTGADLHAETETNAESESVGPSMTADAEAEVHLAAGGSANGNGNGVSHIAGGVGSNTKAAAQQFEVDHSVEADSHGSTQADGGVVAHAISGTSPVDHYDTGEELIPAPTSTYVEGTANVGSGSLTLVPEEGAGASTRGDAAGGAMGASVAYPVLQEEWKEIQEPLAAGSQISGEITASSDSRSDNVHGHGAGGDTLSVIHAGTESSEFADDGAYTFNEHESGGMAATNANSAAFDGKGEGTIGTTVTEGEIDAGAGTGASEGGYGASDTSVMSMSVSATFMDGQGVTTGIPGAYDGPAASMTEGTAMAVGLGEGGAGAGLESATFSETLTASGTGEEAHIEIEVVDEEDPHKIDEILNFDAAELGGALGASTGIGMVQIDAGATSNSTHAGSGAKVHGGSASNTAGASGANGFIFASEDGAAAGSDSGVLVEGEGGGFGSADADGLGEDSTDIFYHSMGIGNAHASNGDVALVGDENKTQIVVGGGISDGTGGAFAHGEQIGNDGASSLVGSAVGSADASSMTTALAENVDDINLGAQGSRGAGAGAGGVKVERGEGFVTSDTYSEGSTLGQLASTMGDHEEAETEAAVYYGDAYAGISNVAAGEAPEASSNIASVSTGDAVLEIGPEGEENPIMTSNFADSSGGFVTYSPDEENSDGDSTAYSEADSASVILDPGQAVGAIYVTHDDELGASFSDGRGLGYGIGNGGGAASADERFRAIKGSAGGQGFGVGAGAANGIAVHGFDVAAGFGAGLGVGAGYGSAGGQVTPNPHDNNAGTLVLNLGGGGGKAASIGHGMSMAAGGGSGHGEGDFVIGRDGDLDYLGVMAGATGGGTGAAGIVAGHEYVSVGGSGSGYGMGGAEAYMEGGDHPVAGVGSLYTSGASSSVFP